MRRKQLLPAPILNLVLLLVSLPSALGSAQPQPFLPAQTPNAVRRYHAAPVEALAPRQTSTGCISGTFSCSDQGSAFSGICCSNGQTCALDALNSPACCPSGNVCTGTAPTSYRPPSSTSASFVANPYFSFPYIVTSFSNTGACTRAVSACSANYAACTSALEGVSGGVAGGGGVTVVVGGTTTISGSAAGTTTYPASAATSVCSSLSSAACFGIQSTVCSAGSTGVFSVGSANAAARQTGVPCVGVVAGVAAAGVGFGMMGI